jgi:LacI family transcriptional regulator
VARRVTLARVAQDAGVSPATVSKVVNGRAGVGAATRLAVEKAVEAAGYVAIAERQRPYRGVGEPLVEVLVETLHHPYNGTFLDGAAQATEAAGAGLVVRLLTAVIDEDALAWAQKLARAGRVGVIEVTARYSKARADALRTVGLPLVLVDPLDEPRTSVYNIGATNWAGGVEATRHLLELGHRRIAYVGGPPTIACNIARQHGYMAALHQADVAFDPSLVQHGSFTFEHGLDAAMQFLSRRQRPTAIFAGSDLAALGVLEAARRLRISVPDQLSFVGFDNTGVAASSAPPLTTVHQPILQIGEAAVRTLFRLASGDAAPKRIELATHLVVRESTAPVPTS